MKVIYIYYFICLILLINFISAETLIINSSTGTIKDTYISGANANNNYGASTSLTLGNGTTAQTKRILISFDISGLPLNINITSSIIYIYKSAYIGDLFSINAHQILQSWGEGTHSGATATAGESSWTNRSVPTAWTTPGLLAGTDYNSRLECSVTPGAADAYVEFNVLNATKEWYNGTVSNNGIILIGNTNTGASNTFQARETSGTSQDPYMIIQYEFLDKEYPQFSNKWDNNASLNNFGMGLFNITLTNTNGTVWLRINNTNISATNLTLNVYNVSYYFTKYGNYNYTWWAYSNDSHATINFSQNYDYTVNRSYPLINIVYPLNNTNTSNNKIEINYTASGINLSSCKWSNNSGVNNYTLASCINITGINWSQGWNNIIIWVNDTVGNVNSSSVRFFVDSITPILNILFPVADNLWFNYLINVNYTVSDSGIGLGSCKWSNNSGLTNNTITCGTNITGQTWSEGLNNVTIYANDSVGNIANVSRLFYIDTITPSIVYGINIETNGANKSQNYIFINTTWAEINFKNITFKANTNIQTFAVAVYNYTFTGLSNGVYYYNVTVCDLANNCNITDTYKITLDVNDPNAVLIFPLNNSYNNTVNQNFTVSLSDNIELLNATLYIWNQSGEYNVSEISFGSGITNYVWGTIINLIDGVYKWWVNVFDKAENSFITSNFTFTLDTVVPLINIVYPLNNTNTSNNKIEINYTASDLNPISCKWSNNSGLTNNTITCGTNITGQTWSEGLNNIIVWVNDSAGNMNSSSVTFFKDTNAPSLTIVSPQNITYKDLYSYNYSLNVTSVDLGAGISTYWYSLNGATNITFTPNITLTNLKAGANNISVWVNDTLNNINSANVTFYLAFTPKIDNINISNSTIGYVREDITEGLVGWWKLDKNYSIQEDSIYGNNATKQGSSNVLFTNNGKIGGAYTFEGIDGFLRTQDSDYLTPNTTGSFSVSFWLNSFNQNFIGGGTTLDYKNIMGKGGSNNWEWWFRMYNGTTNSLYFTISNLTGTGVCSSTLSGFIEENNWIYVTGIYNGSYTFLYKNGNLVDSDPCTRSDFSNGNGGMGIGGRTGTTNEILNGSIDELRIYNRSLTAEEIKELYSITNPTFQEFANVTINATIIDEDTPQANLYYSWFVDSVNVLSGFLQNILSWVFNKQSQNVTLIVNDTNNYQVIQQWNVSQTFIFPLINIVYPLNNTNTSNINLEINYTVSDVNLQSCWWTKNKGLTNNTITCGTNITGQTWSEGINNIIIYANDSVGNINSSYISFNLDTIGPIITVYKPSPGEGFNTLIIPFNFSVTDISGLSSCWYKNDTDNINITVNCNQNFTFSQSQGNHYIYFYANDTLNNIANKSIYYSINVDSPAVTLQTPSLNEWINHSDINFTFIALHALGLGNCSLFGNWSGWHLNQTNLSTITSGASYSFYNNLSDGKYKWNVLCYESLGLNSSFSSLNYTFNIDTIFPVLNIVSPENISYINETLSLNFSVYDLNLDSCWYSLNGGINITLVNCSNVTFSSPEGSIILTLWANDSVNHVINQSITYNVNTTITSPEQDGGSTERIPVALILSNYTENKTIISTNLSEIEKSFFDKVKSYEDFKELINKNVFFILIILIGICFICLLIFAVKKHNKY